MSRDGWAALPTVPRGCLQFVIVVFPDHTHLLFLKTYLLKRCKGPDALAVCRAHLGLPVGFPLRWYSVLFTVESLSLLYLLLIS